MTRELPGKKCVGVRKNIHWQKFFTQAVSGSRQSAERAVYQPFWALLNNGPQVEKHVLYQSPKEARLFAYVSLRDINHCSLTLSFSHTTITIFVNKKETIYFYRQMLLSPTSLLYDYKHLSYVKRFWRVLLLEFCDSNLNTLTYQPLNIVKLNLGSVTCYRDGLWSQSKRVRTPIAPLHSLSDK